MRINNSRLEVKKQVESQIYHINNMLIESDAANDSIIVVNTGDLLATNFEYFPLGKHWSKKIKPVFESTKAQEILTRDFKKYVKMKQHTLNAEYESRGVNTRVRFNYSKKCTPHKWDSVDWRFDRVGRPPAYDKYVCHGACHWIVNTLLFTAFTIYPTVPWRIVTSDQHSTVWDGANVFFDMNWLSLGIPVEYCFEAIFLDSSFRELDHGECLYLYS